MTSTSTPGHCHACGKELTCEYDDIRRRSTSLKDPTTRSRSSSPLRYDALGRRLPSKDFNTDLLLGISLSTIYSMIMRSHVCVIVLFISACFSGAIETSPRSHCCQQHVTHYAGSGKFSLHQFDARPRTTPSGGVRKPCGDLIPLDR